MVVVVYTEGTFDSNSGDWFRNFRAQRTKKRAARGRGRAKSGPSLEPAASPIEKCRGRGGAARAPPSSLMSALTLFEILKFNEPIRSSILPARAPALLCSFLFLRMVRGANRLPREKKGDWARWRAFVIRFNGGSLRPFRILDRSKASTNLVDQLRQHRADRRSLSLCTLFLSSSTVCFSSPSLFFVPLSVPPLHGLHLSSVHVAILSSWTSSTSWLGTGVFCRAREKTFARAGASRPLAREIPVRGFNNHAASARFVARHKAN